LSPLQGTADNRAGFQSRVLENISRVAKNFNFVNPTSSSENLIRFSVVPLKGDSPFLCPAYPPLKRRAVHPPSPEEVQVFTFDGTSTLNQGQQITLKTPADLTAIAVTPNGKFLYVADATNIYGFVVNAADGSLSPVAGSPFPDGHTMARNASTLQVDNSNQFLYFAVTDLNAVVAFKIDPNSGAIAPVPGSPFAIGATPASMAVARTP